MKKIIIALSAVFLSIMFTVVSFAAETPVIYSDSVSVSGDELIVSVKIKDNCGIMGFKLSFTYDKDILKPERAVNGLVLKNGLFNDSIEVSDGGEFSVIWNSSSNVMSDGEIAELHFRIKRIPESGSTLIKISCSQPDTFNEKWEDVKLNCEDITVKLNESQVSPESETDNLSKETRTDFAEAVKAGLKEIGEESVDKIPIKKVSTFSTKVKSELKKTTSEYENMTADEIFSLAKKINDKDNISGKPEKNHYIPIVSVVVILMVITVFTVLYRKKHINGGKLNEE